MGWLQCAALNFIQYLLAKLLLHSPLKEVKLLRTLIAAPECAEVITLCGACVWPAYESACTHFPLPATERGAVCSQLHPLGTPVPREYAVSTA